MVKDYYDHSSYTTHVYVPSFDWDPTKTPRQNGYKGLFRAAWDRFLDKEDTLGSIVLNKE